MQAKVNPQPRPSLTAAVRVTVFALMALVGVDPRADVGMVTGAKEGTYYAIGQDIAAVAAPRGLQIEVKTSEGSLDNIDRIDSDENAGFGIVQSDVLGYLKRNPKVKRGLVQRLRIIFPFYLEEVHVLARRDIKSLRDLDGKRVAIGEPNSGTWLTATNILKILGIEPKERQEINTSEAQKRLLRGEIDALVYVAGKPVKAFAPLASWADGSQGADTQAAVAQLHFVPMSPASEPEIFREYDSSSIGREDYPWLNEKVPVAAVRAVLIGFDFSNGKTPYAKERCRQFAILGQAVRDSLGELQSQSPPHHLKWREVDLRRKVPDWRFDTCAHPRVPNRGRSLRDELEPILETEGSRPGSPGAR